MLGLQYDNAWCSTPTLLQYCSSGIVRIVEAAGLLLLVEAIRCIMADFPHTRHLRKRIRACQNQQVGPANIKALPDPDSVEAPYIPG